MSGAAPPIPLPIQAVADQLAERGHTAAWVGGCLRDFLRGAAVRDFDLCTSASTASIVAAFPRGVPIGRETVMVPTECGPVDVTPFRGSTLTLDLGRRDFTVNAVAWDSATENWLDPFDGRSDLRRGILRAVGDPAERLREDPLRGLRAARFVATLGLRPTPELAPQIAACSPSLLGVASERIRHELELLLLAPECAAGLAFLRASGVEAALAPALRDTPLRPWIDRLPTRLEIRLAAWLAGSDPQVTLGPLRFGEARIAAVARRAARHPIDAIESAEGGIGLSPNRLRHLLAKVGPPVVEDLLLLCEAERGCPLVALRSAIETALAEDGAAIRREDLALDGRSVMKALGAPPGRRVGAAIRYLMDRVLDAPALNTEDGLRCCLEEWVREKS